MRQLQELEAQTRTDLPDFRPGDTVRVHVRIVEGDKERVQVFEGVVLQRRRAGASSSFAVRKISYGVGVERVFPLHSPTIAKIELKARGARAPLAAHLSARPVRQGRAHPRARPVRHPGPDGGRGAPPRRKRRRPTHEDPRGPPSRTLGAGGGSPARPGPRLHRGASRGRRAGARLRRAGAGAALSEPRRARRARYARARRAVARAAQRRVRDRGGLRAPACEPRPAGREGRRLHRAVERPARDRGVRARGRPAARRGLPAPAHLRHGRRSAATSSCRCVAREGRGAADARPGADARGRGARRGGARRRAAHARAAPRRASAERARLLADHEQQVLALAHERARLEASLEQALANARSGRVETEERISACASRSPSSPRSSASTRPTLAELEKNAALADVVEDFDARAAHFRNLAASRDVGARGDRRDPRRGARRARAAARRAAPAARARRAGARAGRGRRGRRRRRLLDRLRAGGGRHAGARRGARTGARRAPPARAGPRRCSPRCAFASGRRSGASRPTARRSAAS